MTDDEKLEELVRISQENFGCPRILYIPDPTSGNTVYVDLDNPSEEALELLRKLVQL